jgi:putative oxidoreductase
MATITRNREEVATPVTRLDAVGLTLLRVFAGVVMAAHGWQKVQTFSEWQQQVVDLGVPAPEIAARLAVVGELGGGIALILGLLTPVAGLLILGVMATAIATVHAGNGLFAANGGWEFPALIAMVAIYFVVHGGGPISVDALVERKMQRGGVPPLHGYERTGDLAGGTA